jgi:hypothetical protein
MTITKAMLADEAFCRRCRSDGRLAVVVSYLPNG